MSEATTIRQAIYKLLTNYAPLMDLLPGGLHHKRAPQGVVSPYLVYFRNNTQRVESFEGDSNLARARFQFDIWGEQEDELEQIEEVLRDYVHGKEFRVDKVEFVFTHYDNDFEDYDEETGLSLSSVDYAVWSAQLEDD